MNYHYGSGNAPHSSRNHLNVLILAAFIFVVILFFIVRGTDEADEPSVVFDSSYSVVGGQVNVYNVYGFGGSITVHAGNTMPFIHFAGMGFPIEELMDETIEGVVDVTQDSLRIQFAVSRNDIIAQYHNGLSGAIAGPEVEFEYILGFGIGYMVIRDFENPPLTFEFTEESAIALADIMRQALTLVSEIE